MKTILLMIISMLGSFVFYNAYNYANEWKFTIAFLGGATMVFIYTLVDKKILTKE